MDVETAVIFDEAKLPETIHEETDARAGRAYDGSQGLLADLRDYVLRRPLFPEIREQEEGARKTLFAGVEELVYQILLDAIIAGEHVRQEELGELGLLVQRFDHAGFRDPQDLTRTQCGRGRHADLLRGEAPFAEEQPGAEQSNHGFFAVAGRDSQADVPFLDVVDRVGRVALR